MTSRLWHKLGLVGIPVALICLGWYYGKVSLRQRPTPALWQKEPKKHLGKVATVSYVKVEDVLSPHQVRAKVAAVPFVFHFSTATALSKGSFFSARVRYVGKGSLRVLQYWRHPRRRWKRWIGALGVLISLGFLFFLCYKCFEGVK